MAILGGAAGAGNTDAFGNLLVSLGTGLDNLDDNTVISPGAMYPAQGVGVSMSGGATTATFTFPVNLSGPAVYDIRSASFWVENAGTSVTINTATLAITDTVGSTNNVGQTYVCPGVSIASGSTGQVLFPILDVTGLKTVTLTMTFASGVNTGTVKCQARFSPFEMLLPANYLVTGNVQGISDTNPHSIIAAQGSNTRLYLMEVIVTNSNIGTAARVLIENGSGGTVLTGGFCSAPGGFKSGPLGPYGRGIPLSTNTALFMVSSATATIDAYAICRIGA